MSRVIEIDLTGAPPAQGGVTSDHIPEGRYRLRVEDITEGTSQGGKRMITAVFRTFGQPNDELNNKRLIDRFTFPSKEDDSLFPIQRLHACLLALGLPVEAKKQKIDLDKQIGKTCDADVIDEEAPARGNFPPRVYSKPNAYFPIDAPAGAKTAAPAQAATPPPPAAAPAPAPEVDVAALAEEMDEVLG